MRGSCAARGVLAAAGTVVALSSVAFAPSTARADDQQNRAVRGLDSQLYSRGFGGYIGNGVRVGVHEAGNNIPNYAGNGALEINSLLPAGNAFLPNARFSILPQGGVLGPADTVGNHASTVAGTIVASHGTHYGISRNSDITASGFDIPQRLTFQGTLRAGAARAMHNTQGMALAGAHIINQSWGIPQAQLNPAPPPLLANPNNDGNGLNSTFTDWAILSNPGSNIRDLLITVAGNEGAPGEFQDWGSPSDAFNVLNVAATGRINGAGNLVYDQAADYNLSNETSDVGITGFGRINTHMVAPGGDPQGLIGARGTVGAPAASGQFFGTSGGQVEYLGAFNNPANPMDPQNGQDSYISDDRAGVAGLFGTGLVNHGGLSWENDPLGPVAPPNDNPGIGLRGFVPQYSLSNADTHQTAGSAGTSFAAPLVAGAAANLREYGAANGENTDHRVLKAVLMNGASKFSNENGTRLTHKDGVTEWEETVLAGGFQKPDLIRGGNVDIEIGLDQELGTGQLDMLNSFTNYAAGQQGPGLVDDTGYDLDTVAAGAINTYQFTTYGGEFRATLVWDRFVSLADTNGNGQWDFTDTDGNGILDEAEDVDGDGNLDVDEDANANGVLDPGEDLDGDGNLDIAEDLNGNGVLDAEEVGETLTASALTDLDLELYLIDPILGDILIDLSTSDIDNAEHVWQLDLEAGTYAIDVLNQDLVAQEYALAWLLPTPSTIVLLALAGIGASRRRRT